MLHEHVGSAGFLGLPKDDLNSSGDITSKRL